MSAWSELWTPVMHAVTRVERELRDTVTLALAPLDDSRSLPPAQPGQFHMLWVFGVGEVPISVSGLASAGVPMLHTVRAVGAVTDALCRVSPGDAVGVRGPFGVPWAVDQPNPDGELLVVAGGLGLAPLRPAIRHALAHPDRRARVTVVVGARSPEDVLYSAELDDWRDQGADVRVTVDHAAAGWAGRIGLVTDLIDGAVREPSRTRALVCGPEIMMRAAARRLAACGVTGDRVQVSLERNMQCAVGLCGHCQLQDKFLCTDGPVLTWTQVEPLLALREA